MKVTTKRIDDANVSMKTKISKEILEQEIDKLAKEAAKSMKVSGFRKGKVPAHVVKKMHGEKLEQDAQSEAVRAMLDEGSKSAKIDPKDVIGQPFFKKFENSDEGIDVELEVSLRPTIIIEGYQEVIPTFKKPSVSKKEIDERLEGLATAQAPLEAIKTKRGIKDGDSVIIDFEGKIEGVPFDGGKAEKFSLKIGSKQFIPGFEEQLIGMKAGEEKTINVTFPKEYGAENLAGKETTFDVKLHEIQQKAQVAIDDDFAKKLLHDEKDATVETLKEKIKEQMEKEKLSKLYQEELKSKTIEALVGKFDFALPNNIVEQEIDAKVNQKASQMSKEELESYKKDVKKVEKLREELRQDAIDSVKATFIVDELAKKEGIKVNDQEVSQTIYYEAMMSGQDPQQTIEYYQKNNLLPAIKMGIIEDKLFAKLLGIDN
ncbi:MAG: trigger factor [Campylobacterales bacterium]|nr:trigger factor [Campylobacterales bacterium]